MTSSPNSKPRSKFVSHSSGGVSLNSHRSHRARRNDFNVSEKLDETHLTYLDQGKTFEVRKFELDELAEALLQERLDTQIQVSCPTANHNAQCLITLFFIRKTFKLFTTSSGTIKWCKTYKDVATNKKSMVVKMINFLILTRQLTFSSYKTFSKNRILTKKASRSELLRKMRIGLGNFSRFVKTTTRIFRERKFSRLMVNGWTRIKLYISSNRLYWVNLE